jgi:PAS domain S-box-containing protein
VIQVFLVTAITMEKDNSQLYNSRIFSVFLKYIQSHYPEVDVDEVLQYAGMPRYEVDDQAHWFTQEQADRFHDIVMTKTQNPNIARDAGRYSVTSGALAAGQQYGLAFLGLSFVYQMLGKLYTIMSRGAELKVKKIDPNKVEVISTPTPGVQEKPYQCENRIGTFESLAKLFTDKLATVEHPSCFHKGSNACRYIITWQKTPSLIWKTIRNYSLIFSLIAGIGLSPFIETVHVFAILFLGMSLFFLAAIYSAYLEKKELTKTILAQGDVAKDLLYEINTRHNNSLLVQEIGRALSKALDINEIVRTVVNIMVKRTDFDRGLIMLANKEKTRLVYSAGYGYIKELEDTLKHNEFHLDRPESRGPFVMAFIRKAPFLIDDMSRIKQNLSARSLELTKFLGVKSLICVPILFENESLGILAVDNYKSKKRFSESDMHLLIGVASQTAVGIVNARSFQKVQESEKQYRELVESANSIILRMDTEGNITFFNEFAQKFFGYTQKEIIGQNIHATILPKTVQAKREFEKLIYALRKDPERQTASENENIRRNEDKAWVSWTYKPIFGIDGQFQEILCIGNDITELKRSELERKDLEVRLQRAQKMEAIGALAGGVAHDLNNILSGLVSYPELLLMELPDDSPLKKPILTIQRSGEKASVIVQDLLTLARRSVSVTEVVNLNEIISEYLKSPEFQTLKLNNPSVKIESRLDRELLNISGSCVHLSKVIMNLVTNAAEAMPDGGKVSISTHNQYVDHVVRGYDSVEEGDYVILTVADTGHGISREQKERIFEPFYTTKTMGKSGTGLGLAIVWGSVKDHNGFIDIQTTEGKGTNFTLYFPVTREEIADECHRLSFEDYKGSGGKVLVVDDIKEQREIATQMLEKLGYEVDSVSSGEQAVAYVKDHSVNLLVLDMIMESGTDGLETYKQIIEIKPGIRAIIASGFSENERVKEAQSLGAGKYVKKPYTMEKLGVAVKNEMNR